MGITQLPREILRQILLELHPSDRIRSSLTCLAWADEISAGPLLKDVWLTIRGTEIYSVLPTLINSQRQYRNLRIIGANLRCHNLDLWAKIGKHLRRLQFIECEVEPDVFLSILRNCSRLESLKLKGYPRGSTYGFKFPDCALLEEIRQTLQNVRSLSLNFDLTVGIVNQLLVLMPNVTSLSIRLRPFKLGSSYSEDIPNPWDPRLPQALKPHPMFTELDLSIFRLSDEGFMNIVKRYSGHLQDLRLNCMYLTSEAYTAMSAFTKLRHLYLEMALRFEDVHLEKLVRLAPALETVDLSRSGMLTDRGLTHLQALQRLRHVGLYFCRGLTNDALCDLGKILTLQHIDLEETAFDKKVLKSLAPLEDLRILALRMEMDSESMDIICNRFKKLERLHLLSCGGLTDEDGVKLRLLTRLKCLRLGGASGFTDLTFTDGLRSPFMESIRIRSSPLTDRGLALMALNHGRLRNLELALLPAITDAGLANVLHREPFLGRLVLQRCNSLTDECLTLVGVICRRLIHFEIVECRVSPESIKLFKHRMPLVHVEYYPIPQDAPLNQF